MKKTTKVMELTPGMVVARCVTDINGKVVLSEGAVSSERTIQRLQTWDISEVCIKCSRDDFEA